MLARILKIQSKPPQNLICSLDLTQVPLYVTPTLQVKVVVSSVCCFVIYYPKLSDLSVFSRFWRVTVKFFLGIHQAMWTKAWGSSEASLCKLWYLRCWVFFFCSFSEWLAWASSQHGRVRGVRLPALLLAYPRVSIGFLGPSLRGYSVPFAHIVRADES